MERVVKNFILELFNFVGLLRAGKFYKDIEFYMALLLAFPFYGIASLFIPTNIGIKHAAHFISFQLFSVAFPEEFFFRGFLLPTVNQIKQLKIGPISSGNLISAIAFSLLHLFTHPPIWAIGTFFPALIFGYFREKHNSLWPAVILHFFYNLGYFFFF